jgi:hypothetical protein
MFYFIKVVISAIMIVVISEVSKKYPGLGGLIASLPLLSVLGMIWLWLDTHDTELLAAHSFSTFWFVIPSLPMFLVLPVLLRWDVQFFVALGLVCLLTMAAYLLTIFVLQQFQIPL